MKRIIAVVVVALSLISWNNDAGAELSIKIVNYKGESAQLMNLGGRTIDDRSVILEISDEGILNHNLPMDKPAVGLLSVGQKAHVFVLLKPGTTTAVVIDFENEVPVSYEGDLASDCVVLNEFYQFSQSLSLYANQKLYNLTWQDFNKEMDNLTTKYSEISSRASDVYLKKWMTALFNFESIKTKARYKTTYEDKEMQTRMSKFMPDVTFVEQVIPNDFVDLGSFDINNPMLGEISSDLEMDFNDFFRMKRALEGKPAITEFVFSYIDILPQITNQLNYEKFASMCYFKYGKSDANWEKFLSMAIPNIKDQGIIDEMNRIKAKREEAIRKIQNLKSLEVAPFPMYDIDGNEVYMSDFKGKYVLIDTWATWCGPCKLEIPHLQKKEEKYGDQMVFLSLSFDENHEAWENFVKDEALTGVQVIAGKSSKEFMDYYMIPGYPQFILLGKDGKIVDHNFLRPSFPPFDDVLEGYINN